jgi:predicted ATP-grasp superfamily ATP-dependent carboligase
MDQHTKKYALIIDSFGSHNSLAYSCFINKIIPIHIFSSELSFQTFFFSVSAGYFFTSLIYKTPEKFLEDIKEYKNNIMFVFGCTEDSQRVKDLIDNLLNLDNKHDPNFANIRYSKYELYKKLGQPAEISNFENFIKQHKACIIKPANIENSGGCRGVNFFKEHQTITYHQGDFISSFFEGDEYAVDLVSFNGNHKLISVWSYIRADEEKIWKTKVNLMQFEENKTLIEKIYKTVSSWLSLINHKYGPTHIEIKHRNGEFFCIEINFRLNGHMSYTALRKALEYNQVDLTKECYTGEEKFKENLIHYKTTGYISRIYFLNQKERKYEDIPWDKIEKSPSVITTYKHVWPWENVPISQKTYHSTAAIIIMYSETFEKLEKDEMELRKLLN